MNSKKIFAAVLVFFSSLGFTAEVPKNQPSSTPVPPTLESTSPFIGLQSREKFLEDLKAPFAKDIRPYWYVGVGATTVLWLFKDDLDRSVQKHMSERKPLRGLSTWGDYGGQFYTNSFYWLSFWIYGATQEKTAQRDAYRRSWVMAEASTLAVLTTGLLKAIVREKRPDSDQRSSFPSGHATAAFAFASVVAEEHGVYWGTGAYLFAGLVAASRLNDNKHFVHDVVAGATIGTAFGMGLSRLYLRRQKPELISGWHIMPQLSFETAGLTVSKEF